MMRCTIAPADSRRLARRARALPLAMCAAAGLVAPGCLMHGNDTLEVGGVVPSSLRDRSDAGPVMSDERSVVSLSRENWAETDFVVASHTVQHIPTYARRNTRFEVSARASGAYPTLEEAITLPRGPSESEQIYDALTWPILIMPSAALVPLGIVFEPWIAHTKESPLWEYQRHPSGSGPATRGRGPSGDALLDRLSLPVVPPEPVPAVTAPEPEPAPEPAPEPIAEPAGGEP